MLTSPEKILFFILIIVSVFLSWKSFSKMVKIISSGQDKLYLNDLISRITEALSVLVTQKTVFKRRPVISFLHALIAWAFVLYVIVNFGDALAGLIPDFKFLGSGLIGNLYRLFIDFFSVTAVFAMAFFLIRRFIFKSSVFKFSQNVLISDTAKNGMRRDSLIVGFFIILHIGFRFIGESLIINLDGVYDQWQPLASGFAMLWSGVDSGTIVIFQHISWWLAIGLILAFIPYFPSSKHIHLIMGPVNYLTRPRRNAYGTMERIDFEDETNEQFGVAKLEHLDKSQILDAYACIMCNRCQDACPAYITGKELSPSALEINKRYYINENKKSLSGSAASENDLLEYALGESALWACTSCAACVEVCPVGNEPMFDILNIRRNQVLMESKFPKQLQGAFNGMERNQNPWNINDDRLKWVKMTEGLEVKTVEENPEFDILYWVGCAGAFDQKGQVIAQSFTKILNKANVNFAVLGNKESCTGDSARRAGNEYLFAMMAETNVETLNSVGAKKIVTTCPHCFHTLKNEYPQFGGNYEVVHHTELIRELISNGKLNTSRDELANSQITFHDPCYLGRHNKIFDAPRSDLNSMGFSISEMERNKSNSFCCGAGGAQMWKEEEPGSQSVRQNRLKEAEETHAEILCTSCPFCLTMLRDASNELSSSMEVKDIAQIIAERI